MAVNLFERLDPELQGQLKVMLNRPISLHNIPEARVSARKMNLAMKKQRPAIRGVITTDKTIPGPSGSPDVTIRIYRPEKVSGVLPGLLWIHGGGYILGDIEGDDDCVKELVLAGECAAVSVEYRLAPEHPFPAPLEDCYAALKWLSIHADELHIDRSRLAIGGASAGGGLAAGLALLTRDRAEINIIFQLLVYPMINDCNVAPASNTLPEALFWTRESNLIGWRSYLGCEPGVKNISCHAAAFRADNLRGLAPAYLCVGDLDLFAAEDIEYAGRLVAAGVPSELHVYPGACHGFDMMVPDADVSRRFSQDMRRALKRALHS
jgi:acetyl esterase/lipase